MKKSLLLFAKALALFVAFTFVGCGDDDSKENNNNSGDKIIGSWIYNGYYENGIYIEEEPSDCTSFTVTFNANGSGSETDKDCVKGDETDTFSWESKGNSVYQLKYKDVNPELVSISFINNNQFEITYDGTLKERFTKK